MKRCFSFLLAALFVLSPLFFFSEYSGQADARAKTRLVKRRLVGKKIKKKAKKYRRSKRTRPKSAQKALVGKKTAPPISEPVYLLPPRAGTIVKTFALEEGINDSGAETIISELKSLGVDFVSADVNRRTLQAKFNSQELSTISIIKKLKELGFTVRRID